MTTVIRLAILLTLAATSLAFGQERAVTNSKRSGSNSALEQEIQRLHLEYGRAQVTNDIAMLDRIWADDHRFTNTFGVVQTKADRLADAKSGTRKISSLHLDDIQVRVYGNTAVVTSRGTIQMQLEGTTSASRREVSTYTCKGMATGKWSPRKPRVLLSHDFPESRLLQRLRNQL